MGTNEQDYRVLTSLIFSAVRSGEKLPPISPAGIVSLFLGISVSLILCGSVTFCIGFLMMPWVLGMVLLLFLLGIISCISGLFKAAIINHKSSG